MSLNESMFLPSSSTNSGSSRPKREASRRVKFIFKDYETDFDRHFPVRKKPRIEYLSSSMNATQTSSLFMRQNTTQLTAAITPPSSRPFVGLSKSQSYEPCATVDVTMHTEAEFETSEIFHMNDQEKQRIIRNQPNVVINHSKPFPIALVEDKTNVVYTKALLFLHLFRSYLCPCILCPSCNKILNVSEFSKHLHIDQIDDDEEEEEEGSSTDDSSSSISDSFEFKSSAERENFRAKRKKEKKYVKLIKKSFKILPYCFKSKFKLFL